MPPDLPDLMNREGSPKRPDGAKRSRALMLNLMLPGLGQLYLRQWVLGTILALVFIGAFAGSLVLFLVGMSQYFSIVSGDILKNDSLESLSGVFRVPWVISMAAVAILDMIASQILALRSRIG